MLEYMAGFFDGEGCIGIGPPRGTTLYVLQVSIANTDKRPLGLFHKVYGGKLLGPLARGERCKPIYHWKAESKKAEQVVADLLPFLIIKRKQAELALEFRRLFEGSNILPRGNAKPNQEKRDRILKARADCYKRMRALNQRGNLHASRSKDH